MDAFKSEVPAEDSLFLHDVMTRSSLKKVEELMGDFEERKKQVSFFDVLGSADDEVDGLL